jgi:hypothetical protein
MSINTFFTTVSSYSGYPDICENCSLEDRCNRNYDKREDCYWDYYTTIEAMKEEDEDYKKRQEARLTKEQAKKQEEETAKFYTENPDFLEVM